jgi:S1-C subfamily serine protease
MAKTAAVVLVLLLASSAGWAQQAKARPYLGISVLPAESEKAGVTVQQVTPESPAAKAGLKEGDRIVQVDTKDVRGVEKFLKGIAAKKPGEKVTLQVWRDGKERNIVVTLGERLVRAGELPPAGFFEAPGAAGRGRPAFLGVQTQPLNEDLKKRLQTKADAGVVVTEIIPNSPAARAGLRRSDVITALDDKSIRNPAELREAIQKAGAGKEIALHVTRGEKDVTLKATLRDGTFGPLSTPGVERLPILDLESMRDASRRIQELERRVEDLEKRLRQLEKK